MRHFFFGAVAALACAMPASAFTAQNGLRVEAVGETAFDVPWSGRSDAAAFWCAAGDYAVRVLHVPKSARIYRYSPPPRRSGEGIRFGLDPAEAVPNGLLRLQGGKGMSAAHGRLMCNRYRQER